MRGRWIIPSSNSQKALLLIGILKLPFTHFVCERIPVDTQVPWGACGHQRTASRVDSSQPACGARGSNLVNTILLAGPLTAFSKKLLVRNRVGVASFVHFPGWHPGDTNVAICFRVSGAADTPWVRDLERIL